MQRYVFYDFETTGTDVTFSQPLQFAAIVLDSDLNVLETVDWRCRISPHILPSPYAIKVTNLAPEQVTNDNLPSTFEFAQRLHEFIEKWQPAIWIGYNTIAFDEPMMRQLFYQNLQPSIYATSMNGNSRLDVLKMVFAVHAERPGMLNIPKNETGKASFKLDQLAPANGFAHENAHDALADVEATIFIFKKIRKADREFFDALIATHDKSYVGYLLRRFAPVQVTLRFGGHPPKTYLGSYCGTNRQNKNEIGFVSFESIGAEDLVKLNNDQILEAINDTPKVIRPLSLNKAETFIPIQHPTSSQLKFCKIISQAEDFRNRVSEALSQRFEDFDLDIEIMVEQRIHEGFYSSHDQAILREYQVADWSQRKELTEQFEDKRLIQLGRRLIVFNAPHLVTEEQWAAFKSFVKSKWEYPEPAAKWVKISDVHDDLMEMENDESVSQEYLERLIVFYKNYLKAYECDL